jgi:hypothetical protein
VEDLRAIRTARISPPSSPIKAVRPGDYLAVAVPTVTTTSGTILTTPNRFATRRHASR